MEDSFIRQRVHSPVRDEGPKELFAPGKLFNDDFDSLAFDNGNEFEIRH